ncbi:MAG: hypothetical protein BAJALOKI1v1_1090010 [Promethearchaeota archaeon]|nr:MAG: hypothetical protein BAJALOKI1v1_1090010 [Candidatus Lokiarchaeota archaeon]
MPMIEGWEVSPDRKKVLEKMLSTDPIGEPLLVSKCQLQADRGTIIASDNGFSWRIKMTGNTALIKAGKSKWVRWYDVNQIINEKPNKGMIKIEMFKRKKGALVTKNGKPKVFRWRFILNRKKNEPKDHFKQRRQDFYRVMNEIFQRNKPDEIPAVSDSRM